VAAVCKTGCGIVATLATGGEAGVAAGVADSAGAGAGAGSAVIGKGSQTECFPMNSENDSSKIFARHWNSIGIFDAIAQAVKKCWRQE